MKLIFVNVLMLINVFCSLNCSSNIKDSECTYDVNNISIGDSKLLDITKHTIVNIFGDVDSTTKHFDEIVDDIPFTEYFIGSNTFLFKGDELVSFKLTDINYGVIGVRIGDSLDLIKKNQPCIIKMNENRIDNNLIIIPLSNKGEIIDEYIKFRVKDSLITEIKYQVELI